MITDDVIHERNLLGLRVGFAAATPEELALELEIPPEALARTVREYNEAAARGEDPRFHKRAPFLQPIGVPPASGIGAIDLRVDHGAIYATFTLGGLATDPEGQRLIAPVREYLVSTQSGGRPPAWQRVTTPAASVSETDPSSAVALAVMPPPGPAERAPLRSRRDRFTAAAHAPAGRPRGGGELAVASWLVSAL